MNKYRVKNSKFSFLIIGILCLSFLIGTVSRHAFMTDQEEVLCENSEMEVETAHFSDEIIDTEIQWMDISLSEAVQGSNLIVKGVYAGPVECTTHIDHTFDVTQLMYGDYDNDSLAVCEYPDLPLRFGGAEYKIGDEYLLILEKNVSVYREHDRFYPVAGLFVPLSCDGPVIMQEKEIGEEGIALAENPEEQLARMLPNRSGLDAYSGTEFVPSIEIDKVDVQSSHVLEVIIGDILNENENLGTTCYECEVLNVYSGCGTAEQVFINFFTGSVEPGRNYLVAVNQVEPDSLVYALAAKENAVFAMNSAEADTMIANLD